MDPDPGGPKTHMDPTDPDPDPQHCLVCSMLRFVFQGAYLRPTPGDN
jgi:hypothetical protein